MPIVFSAITPHPPILIPNIGKENHGHLAKTTALFSKLRDGIKSSGAETILIISPHGIIQRDTFSMNLHPEFRCHFEEFGDFATRRNWIGNVGLAHRLKEAVESTAPLQLISEAELDHGSSVPLFLLTDENQKIKIVPLYYSGLDRQAHFHFGQLLGLELQKRNDPVAVVASGDLSHRIEKRSPGGYSPKAKKFDTRVIKYISEKNNSGLIDLDQDLVMEAGECGLKSIMILHGILDGINYKPRLLSYEHPFGIGYLTMNMEL